VDGGPWEVLGPEHGPANVIYFDESVEFGRTYLYTSVATSKHGEMSLLSEQIQVILNKDWKVLGEIPPKFISNAGVRMDATGPFVVSPPRKRTDETIIDPDRSGVSSWTLSARDGDDVSSRRNMTHVMRVESLDTGEQFDRTVNVTYDAQSPRSDDGRPPTPGIGGTIRERKKGPGEPSVSTRNTGIVPQVLLGHKKI
jgi:hypothetical protein